MTNDRKRHAQLQVMTARLEKVYSLSFGLLRSDAAYEAFLKEQSAVKASGQTMDEQKASVIQAVEQMQNNASTRSFALLAFHLGALFAVVEKWRRWKFVDPEVDRLLQSPFLKILEKYRHTIFHVDRYDAKGTVTLLDKPQILSWTKELSEAIRRALQAMIPKS